MKGTARWRRVKRKQRRMSDDLYMDVSLDNQKPNERELDTVAVLMAIQKARDEKDKGKRTHSKKSAEVSIEENTDSKKETAEASTSRTPDEGKTSEVGNLQLQIESIREKAGEGWLHTLNTLQSTPTVKVHEFDSPYISPNLSPGATQPTTVVLAHTRVPKQEPPPILPVLVHGLLPAALPDMEDGRFITYLRSLANDLEFDLEDSFTEILWCHMIYQPNPTSAFPCCIAMTKNSLQFYEIMVGNGQDNLAPGDDLPHLRFHHQVSLDAIKNVVTGMNDVYVKIFTTTSNIALVCLNSNPPFIDLLMRFKTNRMCDSITYSSENEEIQKCIDSQSGGSDILLYALCACCLFDASDEKYFENKTKEICAVMVTTKQLFLARHNYFSNGDAKSASLSIMCSFSLEGDVVNVETTTPEEGASQSARIKLRDSKGAEGSCLVLEIFMAENLISFGFLEFFKNSGETNVDISELTVSGDQTGESGGDNSNGATPENVDNQRLECGVATEDERDRVENLDQNNLSPSLCNSGNLSSSAGSSIVAASSPECDQSPMQETEVYPTYSISSYMPPRMPTSSVESTESDDKGVIGATDGNEEVESQQISSENMHGDSEEWAVIDTISAAGSDIRRLVSKDVPSSVLEDDDIYLPHSNNSSVISPIVIQEDPDYDSPAEPVKVEHVKKKRSRHRRHKGGIKSPDSLSTCSSGSRSSTPASTPERPYLNKPLRDVQEAHKVEMGARLRAALSRVEQENSPAPDLTQRSKVESRQSDGKSEDMSSLYALVKETSDTDVKDGGAVPKRQSQTSEKGVVVVTNSSPPSLRLSVPRPPAELGLGYPSRELLDHLKKCNQNIDLINPLSKPMHALASMNGEEVLNFFHSAIIQIGSESEELRHLVWACVVPFTLPMQEIITCIMLSTRAVYFVSDSLVNVSHKSGSYRSHTRNKSDSIVGQRLNSLVTSQSLSSGLVGNTPGGMVKPYNILQLNDIRHVNVGMFDQCFRLAGSTPENVYSCVTRNHVHTETFVKQISRVLMLYSASPSPDLQSSGEDFYKAFKSQRSLSAVSKGEYEHPSRVKFHYASEDMIVDLAYVIHEHIQGSPKPHNVEDTTILLYLLVFQMDTGSCSNELQARAKPRTLVITNNHLTLLDEDLVNYPFPDFVMAPPSVQHYRVLEVRNVEYLKRVVLSDFKSHDLTLVFSDLSDEIVVDASMEYFGSETSSAAVNEVTWVLAIQSLRDKDRLLKLLSRLWSDFHNEEKLSVQVNE